MSQVETKSALIGLLGHQHSGRFNPGYGQNAAYVEYFRQFGDVIIIDAQCDQVIPVDLLVLPGGRDVNPMNYKQKPLIGTQSPDLEYEWFFANMFEKYLEKANNKQTAIYGICAGFQNIIVHNGGSLQQEYAQKQSNDFRGELVDSLEFNNEVIQKYSNIREAYNKEKHNIDFKKTNSIHHQSAIPSDITNDFDILATNKEFSNVEFIIHKELPIAAEQSHPEERINPILTDSIINQLLNSLQK
jgi:gamma-glutamyl-gamma-aminobutyrate hydrolase PuuD